MGVKIHCELCDTVLTRIPAEVSSVNRETSVTVFGRKVSVSTTASVYIGTESHTESSGHICADCMAQCMKVAAEQAQNKEGVACAEE